MKADDRKLFQALLQNHPEFLDIVSWVDGPDPPDIIATDRRNRALGVELTEWLDADQTTHSITIQEHEMRWLEAVNREPRPVFRNISRVMMSFRRDTRFQLRQAGQFCREFLELLKQIDEHWVSEIEVYPQRLWLNFASHPTLRQHLLSLWFPPSFPGREPNQGWWVSGEAKGGAYDPRWATDALLERIEEKVTKPEYPALKGRFGLSELVLVLHYDIRGIIHNTPYHGINRELEDTLAEATTVLKESAGPFDQVFLYLALNEGSLFQLYPSIPDR